MRENEKRDDVTKVETYVLANGLTVWLNADPGQNKVIGTVVAHVGAKDSPNTGIPHYFEHIMFKGTSRLGTIDYAAEKPFLDEIEQLYHQLSQCDDAQTAKEIQAKINTCSRAAAKWAIPNEFNKLVSYYGGSQLNAATGYDTTIYYNTFNAAYLEHWCALYAERFSDPVFRLFQSELETVYEEKNMLDDQQQFIIYNKILERFAGPHPYASPLIGTTEALKRPDLIAMKAFYEKYYVASNMSLLLCGNFDIDLAKKYIDQYFSLLPKGSVVPAKVTMPKPFNGTECFKVKYPVSELDAAMFMWRGVPGGHVDEVALDIIAELLSNSNKTGFLDELARESNYIDAGGLSNNYQDLGAICLFVLPKYGAINIESAEAELLKSIERIKRGDFSDEMLEQVKRQMIKRNLSDLEELNGRNRLFTQLLSFRLPPSYIADYNQQLRQLSKKDLLDCANKYFTDGCLLVEKETGSYPKDKVPKPNFKPLKNDNISKSSVFAKELEGLPISEVAPKFVEFEQLRTAIDLDGKDSLRHLYVHKNPVNNIFSLDLVFRKGYIHDAIIRELPAYLNSIAPSTHTAQTFKEALQKIGAEIEFSAYAEKFVIELNGFDEYIEETLELLSLFITKLKGSSEALEHLVENKLLKNHNFDESLSDKSSALSEYIQYGKESRYLVPFSLERIKTLTHDDLYHSFQSLMKMEQDIHYVGNRSPEELVTLIRRYLPACQACIAAPEKQIRIPQEIDSELLILRHKDAQQAILNAFIYLDALQTIDDRLALNLYNYYLGSGMNSLLFQEIREYRSLAYGVYSTLALHPYPILNPGPILQANLSTQADKLVEALVLLKDLLKRRPDSEERLENTRIYIMNYIANAYPSFRYKTKQVIEAVRLGFDKDPYRMIYDYAQRVTLADLQRIYDTYIAEKNIYFGLVADSDRLNYSELKTLGYIPKEISIDDIYNN